MSDKEDRSRAPDAAWPREVGARIDRLGRATMEVVVELGRTRLPLEEVLNAEPGSIFETDQVTNQPLNIYVNDVLFARGETVVIQSKLAVRVTEFVAVEDR